MGTEQRTTRGMMAKANREVVVEDGFKYKRRKSAAAVQEQEQQQSQLQLVGAARGTGGPGGRAGGVAAVAGGSRGLSSGYYHHTHRGGGPSTSSHPRHQYQNHQNYKSHPSSSASLPADYPGMYVHERIPQDLPEDERFQMLVSEICEAECMVERERLMREHGPAEGARMAKALEDALGEFQYRVEELIVRGELTFDQSGAALREMRDAKHDAMRAVATQLEDESAQWSALEQQSDLATEGGAVATTTTAVNADGVDGEGNKGDDALATMKRDAEEAMEAVRSMLAAEAAAAPTQGGDIQPGQHVVAAPGEIAASVEEARRKMAMQAEGLGALVEGVEALCVRAERAAEVFSKALADNDFRGLPHVDSPQALLKTLVASKK